MIDNLVRGLLLATFVALLSSSSVLADTVNMDKSDKESPLPDFLQYRSYGNVNTNYAIPHITKREVLDWAMQHVADLMSFDARNANEHFKKIQSFFVRSGWEDFTKYIASAKIREDVTSSDYALITIIDGVGYIKREGPLGEVYRWVIEMPILMTFYKLDTYGNPKQDISATARATLLLTVTRVAKGGGKLKVAISKWKGTNLDGDN